MFLKVTDLFVHKNIETHTNYKHIIHSPILELQIQILIAHILM